MKLKSRAKITKPVYKDVMNVFRYESLPDTIILLPDNHCPMKKVFLCLMLAVLSPVLLPAQPRLETSESFGEPEEGWNKVLQLQNGNTFFFHFTQKNGIEVRVYGKDRRVIAEQVVTSALWDPKKLGETAMEGVYEIGGQPVLFLHQKKNRTPSLYRVQLDPATGAVIADKLIGTLPKYKVGSKWAIAYGGVSPMDFHIEKDPYSDHYAVVNFNTFSHESGERIEVVYYDGTGGTHKVRNRAYYDVPEGGFKYLNFIAMAVDRKNVYLCTYGYHDKWSAEDARIIVSRLGAEDKAFTHKLLDYTEDFRDTKAELLYNPGTNMLQLMTMTVQQTKSNFLTGAGTTYYLALMSYIDPETLMVIASKPLQAKKVSEDLHRQIEQRHTFSGLPQQMVLNRDNTTTVLMEEMFREVRRNSSGAVISTSTTLGSIGISELNDRGIEEDGHVIIKAQVCSGLFEPLYLARKKKGQWSYRKSKGILNNNAFLSFDYVNTEHARYILFNDYPGNFDKDEGERKRKPVRYISDASTVCYRLKSGTPEKYYLFGPPSDKHESRFCYVEASHFLPEQGTYATLLMQRSSGKKEAVIAWVHFD